MNLPSPNQRRLRGSGIILAGGGSSRMGFDKPRLPWREGSLLSHMVKLVSGVMAETIVVGFHGKEPPEGAPSKRRGHVPPPSGVVSARTGPSWRGGLSRPSEALGPVGVPGSVRFVEERERQGPLGGFLLGLEAARFDRVLVLACDLPFVTPEVIREVWRRSRGFDATLPGVPGECHPLCGVYTRRCLEPVRQALKEGKRQFLVFFPEVRLRLLPLDDREFWERALTNLNTPEDYRKARELDGQKGDPLPRP